MRDFDETVDTITISVDIPVNYYDKVAIRAGMVGMPVDIFLRELGIYGKLDYIPAEEVFPDTYYD